MPDCFNLIISTPEKEFYSGDVESLVITTTEGEMGILRGHMLTVVALDVAPIRFKESGQWREAALSGGFAQIKGNQALVLADTAEWPDEIQINRVLEAKRRAEERLRSHLSDVEYIRSHVALRRALTRLHVAQKK